MMKNKQDDFSVFQRKIAVRFFGSALLSVGIVIALYLFLWKERFGDWIVAILEYVGRMEHEEAFLIYHYNFRGYKEIFFVVAIVVVFLILLLLLFRWLTKYFREINAGIDNLVAEDEKKISLSPEMLPFEWKLNTVKQNLQQQKEATALAEQRKDELVMYLAHDIRTPLTSVIGYLSLLEEEPDMTTEEKEKNVHIALDKAYRLEKMVNEFFEITRYHSKQIKLEKQPVDLYYMLMQLRDEFLPSFSLHNNTVSLDLDENITIYADPEKIARVFGNIMKNAAAYSDPNTTIIIAATQEAQYTTISFQNKGKTIPAERLSSLFDKFYRLDEARISDTGGTGLGLAIAKEIILLHGGMSGVEQVFARLGAEGMAIYARFHIGDCLFAIAYGLFGFAVAKTHIGKRSRLYCILISALPSVFDISENIAIRVLAAQYPELRNAPVLAASTFSSLKWMALVLWLVSVVAAALLDRRRRGQARAGG